MKSKRISNYRRGRDVEYKRMAWHRQAGAALVARTAGSHSAVDVIAIYPEKRLIIFEQCKRSRNGRRQSVSVLFPPGEYIVRFVAIHYQDRKGFVGDSQ